MTNEEIESLLKSTIVDSIETAITTDCNTYVNKEHLTFTIGIIQREITNSGLSVNHIEEILSSKKSSVIELGKRILKDTLGKPLDDEYPQGEKANKKEKSMVVDSQGIGIGFSIKCAIYLHFLENPKQEELHNYLKKERIPKASKFAITLKQLYRH